MKIDYILSDTTAMATSAVLKEVTKRAENDLFANFLVIVPEPKSIAIERELLDNSKNGAFSNIFVYSFVRLLSRIGGIEEQEMVSKQTCVMMLRKIILDNIDKLVCYKKTARTIGFAEKIYDTIQQFKSSSYSLEDVKNLANNAEGALKSKIQDILLLFELYEDALSSGFYDDCDRLRKLGEFAKISEFIKNAEVFVVGFDNVTSDMIDVLKEFACNAKSITFSCPYFNEKRKDKYIQDNELYHKFTTVANKLKYPFEPKFVHSGYKGDFWNIENYLYSVEKKEVKSNGSVKLFALENKSQEIEFVAEQILSEVKNGKRYKDIAIVDANFDNDVELISNVFNEYNIPHFISKSYNISNHFFVRFLKNFIEMFSSRFSAEKVLKFLSNPMLNISGFAEFENYVKQFGVNYSSFFEMQDIDDSDEKITKISDIISLLKSLKNEFSAELISEKTIGEFINLLSRVADKFDLKNRLEQIAEEEKVLGLDVDAEVSRGVFEKFKKLNENLTRFMGDKKLTSQEFLSVYLSGFAEEEVNLVPISIDSVLVQKNADGLYKIKDLFIIGATDGSFPAKMADTGILQDSELESAFKLTDKKVEPAIKEINKRAKFTQFELMLLPSEKLIISYPLRSAGSANKPADVVKRLKKLFDIEIQTQFKNNKFITKKNAEKQFSKHIGEYLTGEMLTNAEINAEFNKIKSGLSFHFNDYLEHLCFGNKEFKINRVQEIYFTNNKTSVSQLEKYFSCPYLFFATYGLRLKENKDASLNSLDIGTIVHKFAENFTKKIKQFEGLDEKEFENNILKILSQTFFELDVNNKKNVAVLNFLTKECVRLGKYLYLEQEKSSFKNDAKLNEFEFGGNNAVKLQIDDNSLISIEGKIDRIDRFGDYIRIIDYKTGDVENSLSSIYFGKKIQLVSYLSASKKLSDNKIAGLFYFPIHSDFVKFSQKIKNNYKMQGFLLDDIDTIKYMDSSLSVENNESDFVPLKIKNNKETRETNEFQIAYGNSKVFLNEEEFKNIQDYTESLCSGAVKEILEGFVEPSPFAKLNEKESGACTYCPLNGFCGKEHAKFGLGRRCGGNIGSDAFESKEVE